MTSRWMMVLVAAALVGFAAAPASAQTFTLTANLTGANEPPIPGFNTGAFGDATVVVDMTARTVTYTVTVFNLPSGVTASHIHVGAAGTAGPVVVNFAPPLTASNDFAFSGTVKDTEFVLRRPRRSGHSFRRRHVPGNPRRQLVRERALGGESRRRDPRAARVEAVNPASRRSVGFSTAGRVRPAATATVSAPGAGGRTKVVCPGSRESRPSR